LVGWKEGQPTCKELAAAADWFCLGTQLYLVELKPTVCVCVNSLLIIITVSAVPFLPAIDVINVFTFFFISVFFYVFDIFNFFPCFLFLKKNVVKYAKIQRETLRGCLSNGFY